MNKINNVFIILSKYESGSIIRVMLTIREVAKLSNVSTTTVSRVLNNSGYVSVYAREKVENIIREHNYSPSAVAVNLSRRETDIIGVVVPELDNTFFTEVLSGITEVCDQRGFSAICCDTANCLKKENNALRILGEQRVRGLIITPAQERSNAEDVKRLHDSLKRLDIPIVVLDRHMYVDGINVDAVYFENYESGYIAAHELIKAGNKNIGVITGDLLLRIARDRYQGVQQAVFDAGLELDVKHVLTGDFGVSTAYKLAKQMFESNCYPEGIITCNNRTSLGFLKAANEYKIEIGKDIAIIGIDNIEVLDALGFNLSCVSRDTREMGRASMRLLCDRFENNDMQRKIHTIPCQLILKGSERRDK